jgi:hypothetical protein
MSRAGWGHCLIRNTAQLRVLDIKSDLAQNSSIKSGNGQDGHSNVLAILVAGLTKFLIWNKPRSSAWF